MVSLDKVFRRVHERRRFLLVAQRHLPAMREIVAQVVRASLLQPHIYRRWSKDTAFNGSAILVVASSSLAWGVGLTLARYLLAMELGRVVLLLGGPIVPLAYVLIQYAAQGPLDAPATLLTFSIMPMLLWAFLLALTYIVGTRIFGGLRATGPLARSASLAQGPAVLGLLAFLPVVGTICMTLASLWIWAARVVATREALQLSTGRALATIIVVIVADSILSVGLLMVVAALMARSLGLELQPGSR